MIYDSFCNLVNDFPGRFSNALIFEDRDLPSGQGSLSYAEFGSRIKALADEVRSRGTRTDFVETTHTPGTLIRIFADVCAGCSVVLMDPVLPPLREQMIRRLLAPKLDAMFPAGSAAAKAVTGPASDEQDTVPAEGHLVFFTSGTTHSSKAVVLSARALLHAAWRGQECLPIGESDVLLSILPLSHVFGFVCTMLWGLCYGATVALGRGVRHLMDDPKFFHPTVLPLVPTLAGAMTRFGCYDPELKVILIGAAPLGENELAAMHRKTSAKVYTGYGLTETASGVAITEDVDDPYSLRVCPGVEVRLAPDGEILIRTDSLLQQYIELLPEFGKVKDRHQEIRRQVRKDLRLPGSEPERETSLLDSEGFFHTGDIGFFDNSARLHVSGRKKDIIVLPDGTKVFCPEYEKALSDELGTDELAVSEKNGRPVLLISDKVKKETAESVVAKLNQRLSRSQQIAGITYIDVPLPRTVTGKLKRWMIETAILKGDFSVWKQ